MQRRVFAGVAYADYELAGIDGPLVCSLVPVAEGAGVQIQSHVFGLDVYKRQTLATLWFLCTLCAFLTARNRHIAVHRQWMIRSYVFTLNFIFTRILNPIPAYFKMSEATFALMLLFLSACYLFLTDVYFNRRELMHRRA